jgi:threonine/homoserine/homoserine lactone efflux protein
MEQIIYFGLPLSVLASFALASILIELTPGPNMTYLAIVAAGKGKSFGFATVVGVALGLAIIGLGAAFGITAMINSSAVLYELLRWSGIAFCYF